LGPLSLEFPEPGDFFWRRFFIPNLFQERKVPRVGLKATRAKARADGSPPLSVHKRESVFPVILENEVPLAKGTSRQYLNRIGPTGISLNNGHQFLIACRLDAQSVHEDSGRPKTDGEPGTQVSVKSNTFLKVLRKNG